MTASLKPNRAVLLWTIATLVCVVAVIVVVVLMQEKSDKDVNNFQTCKDAGGAILESYPEQCMLNGKSFTNETQSVDGSAGAYIGLTEQTALDKAQAENKPARIVERDGEPLAVTMDFMPGRLNLSVRDGKVYKVQVEGAER